MQNRRYVIFDFDGTLVDSFPTVVRACKEVFASRGLSVPGESFFAAYRHGDMEVMFAELARMARLTEPAFRTAYDAHYAQNCLTGTTKMARQYAALTEARRQGMGVIVLTNKRQELVERVCRHLFAEDEIDIIIGRQGGEPIKPRHVMADRLRAHGIEAPSQQCVAYYGDSPTDKRSAELLNVRYIDVNDIEN